MTEAYVPHRLHDPSAGYPETNCWTDVVVELLHSRGLEPLAALGCTLSLDFEGDQLTFFKPRVDDLEQLYGVDVRELQVYRPFLDHAREHLPLGRALVVEVDAWWLPDTAGTSYRTEHVKTAIGVTGLEDGELTYFHNAGRFHLHGEDLERAFDWVLPGYTEVVRFDAGTALHGDALRATAVDLLSGHLARRPGTDPFAAFGERLATDLTWLTGAALPAVHVYAFATTRMAGSAAALAAEHVRWALPGKGDAAAEALDHVSTAARALTMRLMRRKQFDPAELCGDMGRRWAEAHARLDELVA